MARRRAGVRLVACATLALGNGGDGTASRAPVAVTVSTASPRVTSEVCAGCHPAEVRAWRGSLHARSWRDDLFARAYAEEPMAFCRGCHAPLGDVAHSPDAVARDEGVSCVSCHDEARRHLEARGHARADSVRAPVAMCEGCHQFNFPVDRGEGRALYVTDRPMQNTVGEWRHASARGDCVGCHMPRGDHRVRGVEDRAFVASGARVAVRARREGDVWRVRATVGPGVIGHAFPTGDLYRRARLVVWVEGHEGEARTRVFARHFEERPVVDERGESLLARQERYDARIAPPGPEAEDLVELDVPARGRATLRWRFEHWRTSPEVARRQGLDDGAVRMTLAEGSAP